MSVNEAAYYIRYAIATYSWPYYVYMHNVRGIKDIFCHSESYSSCCCCCCSSGFKSSAQAADIANRESISVGQQMGNQIPVSNLTVHGDTTSMRYFRAFKFLSKINDCDLIYANFQNELFMVPFCIVVDHMKKTIVITIRGTLSLRDALTDLTAECEYFDVNDLFKNQPCHKGILLSAQNIYKRINELNLLENAFRDNPVIELSCFLKCLFIN
jgi:sn1-specific diacylglycerol lipase